MLCVPSYRKIGTTTIFRDDVFFFRFYQLPGEPRIRLDESGDPVFLLVKYAYADAETGTERDPKLPPGGGFLAFDTSFELNEEELAELRAELQPAVTAEWERFRVGTAEEQARPGVAGTTEAPKVEFAAPTWTKGKVKIDTTQAAGLVSARVAEIEPSLLAGNAACFNVDLTAQGATFMERTLIDSAGGSATDLAPLQVRYDLEFWARLPAVRISIRVDAQKLHDYTRKYVIGRGAELCTTYDMDHTDIEHETLTSSGAIIVSIDNAAGLDEAVVDELRKFSLDLVRQMAQQMFFTPTRDAKTPDKAAAKDPEIGPNQTYELCQFDSTTMSLDFDLEQRSVVHWPISPQTTLETVFAGRSPEELKRFIQVVDLDDDFFKHLNLTIRAFADFAATVDHVEVEVAYKGDDENGQAQEKGASFVFVDEKPQTWSVSLIGSKRSYDWRAKVVFQGQDEGSWSKWTPSSSPNINVSAQETGVVEVSIDAMDVDFEQLVKEVQVTVRYSDLTNGIPIEDEVFQLTSSLRHEKYARRIFRPVTGEASYRTRFKLASDAVEEDKEFTRVLGSQIVINQPTTNVMRVHLQPTGDGWDQVQKVIVELRYRDATRPEISDTFEFANSGQSSTWVVPLRPGGPRDYEYRFTTIMKSGRSRVVDWRKPDESAAGVLLIPVAREGVDVTLFGDLLDLKASPATEVTVTYEILGRAKSQTFMFNDTKAKVCHIELPDDSDLAYSYTVTYNPPGRAPVTIGSGPEPEHDNILVIPAYRVVTPGTAPAIVSGSMVDYSATPLVAVDISESTGATVTKTSVNLASDAKGAEVLVPLVDGQPAFSYRITYFLADGTPREGDWKSSKVARIVVPRLALG